MNQGIGSTIGAGISHDLALGGQGEIQGVDRDIVSGATSAFSTARASSALGLAEEELAPAPVAGAAGYVGADYGAKLGEAEYGASLGPGALAGAAIGTTLGVGAAVAGEVSKPEVRKTASGVDAVLLRLGVGAAVAGEVSKTEVEKAASGVDPAIAAKKDSFNLAVPLPGCHLAVPLPGCAKTKCGWRKYGKKQVRCEYILGCRNSFFIPHHLSSPPFQIKSKNDCPPLQRSYFKCTVANCQAKKMEEKPSGSDDSQVWVTLFGDHNHDLTADSSTFFPPVNEERCTRVALETLRWQTYDGAEMQFVRSPNGPLQPRPSQPSPTPLSWHTYDGTETQFVRSLYVPLPPKPKSTAST